ncbi:DVU0298 family protein [Oceanidesulfovibrio marinus]|uniref:HEAT repeat domain-containing protein n=1 Tax=Oceanidesulfovibrio marinus TaxID=370038 RepID=A0A6P1ZER3_9BACT|nr:DVU0298 family protein [Oceanidesulfovibrio marinus]QJT09682.1 HEAT repeat domain-containing protein [Oceanidesulfovibrio marinus]TVM31042.1 HEAT repeat domain-containing protein [Oceanidesulfovibrio marinus]
MEKDFRRLKTKVQALLAADEWEANLDAFEAYTPRQLIGPLFSTLLRMDEVRWRAVTALGLTVDRMFQNKAEDARIVMRRLMWNLNEESGNIAWGAPESMGEIMAVNATMAQEYSSILVSYMDDSITCGNFIDHPPLRRGVYWGLGRLAQERPAILTKGASAVCVGLEDCEDEQIPGLAAWVLSSMAGHLPGDVDPLPGLEALQDNETDVELYRGRRMETTTVGALAKEALAALSGS